MTCLLSGPASTSHHVTSSPHCPAWLQGCRVFLGCASSCAAIANTQRAKPHKATYAGTVLYVRRPCCILWVRCSPSVVSLFLCKKTKVVWVIYILMTISFVLIKCAESCAYEIHAVLYMHVLNKRFSDDLSASFNLKVSLSLMKSKPTQLFLSPAN